MIMFHIANGLHQEQNENKNQGRNWLNQIRLENDRYKGVTAIKVCGHLTCVMLVNGLFVRSFVIAGRSPAYSGPQR